MRYAKVLIYLLLSCSFACREKKADLREMLLSLPKAEADPELAKLNPAINFHRISIDKQVRRAIEYIPGQKLNLPVAAGKYKFFTGIIPGYFSKYKSPVVVKVISKAADKEEVIWSQTFSPSSAPAWVPVEIDLKSQADSLVLTSDIQDYGLAASVPQPAKTAKDSRPSVIFILVDAMRADQLGIYGNRRDTSPNIDALARSGAVFENVMTTAPFTVTSVSSFFTGQFPWEHKSVFTYNLVLADNLVTLTQELRSQGYATAGFSGTYFHFSDFGIDRGFDFFDETCDTRFFSRDAECLSDKIIAWIDEQKQNPDTPFFLYLHYVSTHSPYDPPDPYDEMFSSGLTKPGGQAGYGDISRFTPNRKWYELPRSPTKAEMDWLISQYDGEVRYADDQINRVLKALDEAGLKQNALIIVTADHGEAFFEHHFVDHPDELHWQVAQIPFILSGPNILPGTKIKDLVRSVDVAPTILDYIGLPPMKTGSGQSMMPLLKGGGTNRIGYDIIYRPRKKYEIGVAEYPYHMLVREPGDKYIELYNLETDRAEKNNIASQNPDLTKHMLGLLPAYKTALFYSEPSAKFSREAQKRLKALHYLK